MKFHLCRLPNDIATNPIVSDIFFHVSFNVSNYSADLNMRKSLIIRITMKFIKKGKKAKFFEYLLSKSNNLKINNK